jgi:hypothetical protein
MPTTRNLNRVSLFKRVHVVNISLELRSLEFGRCFENLLEATTQWISDFPWVTPSEPSYSKFGP